MHGFLPEKGAGEKIIVRLEYDELGARADGEFSVEFESVSMVYSSINDSTYTPPFSSSSNKKTINYTMRVKAQSSNNINYAVAAENGIFVLAGTESNANPIYYYRGVVTNNNLKFAGFCWKIVRTTDTGGVKIIYNGRPAGDGSCNNSGNASQLANVAYNTDSGSIESAEYVRSDGTDSNVKAVVDAWYAANMTPYTSLLEDEKWCNDRSIVRTTTTTTYFGAYDRVKTNALPSLACGEDYQLSVSATEPSKHLNYPVALLTADEATLAGNGLKGYSSTSYLNTGTYWWVLSAYRFADKMYMYRISYDGKLCDYGADIEQGARPVVVLLPNTEITGGDGTVTNPYIVG